MSNFTEVSSKVLLVSVIIPARNEETSLVGLLEDLRAQEQPPAEVIVVDAGSTDRTAEIARAYAPWVKLIQVDRAYPGQARNIGVTHAQYPIVAFWDGEMRVGPQTLKHLVEPILAEKADFVQGRLYLRQSSRLFWIYMIILLRTFTEDTQGGYGNHPVATCAMRKSLYEEVGGCPPYRASEDLLFRRALDGKGALVIEAPDAITWWTPQVSWGGLFRKIRLYARHNLIAGDPVKWFRRLYGYYGLLILTGLLMGGMWGWRLGLLMGGLLWIVLIGVRSTWALWRRRNTILWAIAAQNPRGLSWGYLLWAVPVLVTAIDIASWLGALDWILLDKVGIAPERYPPPRIKAIS